MVFLLFNIGLELSLDRLQSMAKYVRERGGGATKLSGKHFMKCRGGGHCQMQDFARVQSSAVGFSKHLVKCCRAVG